MSKRVHVWFRGSCLFFLAALIHLPAYADCGDIRLDGPRDDSALGASVNACAAKPDVSSADTLAVLGYAFRHGYGTPRSLVEARNHYLDALSVESCEAYSVCGLKGLGEVPPGQNCQVDCTNLYTGQVKVDEASDVYDADTRAHQLLQEILRQDPTQSRNVNELKAALSDLLDQSRQELDKAYVELCTGHIKRAVVTVSVAHQLDKDMRRREKLIAHHQKKVDKDGNARSQATIAELDYTQRRSSNDKRVFFEKYAKSVFATSNCDETALKQSYSDFEREIAEVSVTDLEQHAYRMFKRHVDDARNDQGLDQDWFDNLDELLSQ